MVIRYARVFVLVAMLLSGMVSVKTAMASPSPSPESRTAALQEDGPLLPDRGTPDNDGDGAVDRDDPAPADPEVGAPPPPDPTDNVDDGDDDGLPNAGDPDDDNDGVADREDDVPLPPAVDAPSAPVEDPVVFVPEPAGTDVVPGAEVGVGVERPAIYALPSTGSGPSEAHMPGIGVLIAVVLLLATGGISVRGKRR